MKNWGKLIATAVLAVGSQACSGSLQLDADEDSSSADITNGTRDGVAHPFAGALVGVSPSTGELYPYCSAVLIGDGVVLTAAHCQVRVDADGTTGVTFASQYQAGESKVYRGQYIADPAFNQAQSDPHDIAVVLLSEKPEGISPAALPAAGAFDRLPKKQRFTAVGYGLQEVDSKTAVVDDYRWVATSTLNSVNPAWLRLSQNTATGNGGTCYGDSGGPNFLGAGSTETKIVAGTTITGDAFCNSTSVIYRIDRPSGRHFLGQFVALP